MTALAQDPLRTARLAGRAVLACQSDNRLAAMAADGHERAFDVLVERYRRPLLRHCARILPASRAEDAVQQAFINAHAALVRGDAPADFKPWLYRVAHNAGLNMLRQNGWNYEPISPEVDGVRRPDQIVEQRIELQQTIAAIGELPERQRSALVMRELEGRSYGEIAALLGTGDGAVRQLLNRARGAVRSAATMLTPPPLAARFASTYQGDGSRLGRVAEAIGAVGAGGVAKVGATALVAGTLVVGAVQAPLAGHDAHGDRAGAQARSVHRQASGAAAPGAAAALAHGGGAVAARNADRRHGASANGHGRGRRSGGEHRGSGDRSTSRNESGDHSASGERSGSGDRSGSSGTSGGDHTSSGDGGRSGSTSGGSDGGSTTSSGSVDSGTSGSTSSGSGDTGTSGTSGEPTTSGTSGTSGDGTSGTSGSSVTSGSGTSGSSDASTSTTSGSDGSGSGTTTNSTDSR